MTETDIFNFNYISTELTEDQINELKAYYPTYHRKCWAYKQATKQFKRWKISSYHNTPSDSKFTTISDYPCHFPCLCHIFISCLFPVINFVLIFLKSKLGNFF